MKNENKDKNLLNSDILKSKITYQIDDKTYTFQMFILQETQKLKLILEITDKNRTKSIFSNSFTLYELISLNTFFSKFEDYLDAFNYLMNNYTKVDQTNELSNNKEIKLSLLFNTNEDFEQNNIKQQNVEFVLQRSKTPLKSKINTNLAPIIQNLKMSLEKFNSSINELKSNIDKEKIRKNDIKMELENLINNKFEEIKNNKMFNDIKLKNIEDKKYDKNKEQILINKKIDDINTRMAGYNNELNEIKRNIDSKLYNINLNSNYKNRDNENNNSEKFNEYLKRMNSLKETIRMNKEKLDNFENNINNKLIELNNKINFNSKRESEPTNVVKEIISLNNQDDKKLEKLIQDKVNEQLNYRMKLYEEKILILNKKVIDLEIKNQNQNKFKDSLIKNDDSSFLKDNSYIDFKIHELEEKINKNISTKNVLGRNDDKIRSSYNDNDNRFNKIIENKMEDLKKEIYSMLNKKDDYRMNYKISTEDRNRKSDNKYESKIKPYDLSKSINVNNSYMQTTSKINNAFNNSYDEDNSKSPKYNPNSSFNAYNSNVLPKTKKTEINFESSIITKDNITEDFFLFSPIKELYQYNRFIKLSLCYRLSRDGDTSKNFHSKCDSIGPNLTIVKTKKGYIFGGFTNKGWKHLFKDIRKNDPEFGTDYKDEKAFGFSFNLQKIYKNGKRENVIFCNNKYGAVFNEFFKIYDECSKNGGICGRMRESSFLGQENNYEINGGEETFDVEEIEVFQIVL